MADKDRIRELIYRAIDRLNAQLPQDQQIPKTPSAVLFGPQGSLDSVGFVELVMDLQEALLDEYDVPITVADEQVLQNAANPFRTVQTLVDHLAELVHNELCA
jgi:acyl carrier protein